MQCTIDTDTIQEALRVVSKLAPPNEAGNVTIQSTGSKVFMHSATDVNMCSVLMPAEVFGKAVTFAISMEALRNATKGRKSLSIAYDKTMLKIKSGAYMAELATVDPLNIEDSDESKMSKPTTLEPEQATWLKAAVAAVSLKPTIAVGAVMPVSVKLTSKGAFVTCYDRDHLSYVSSKEISGDMDITLPLDTFASILDTFYKSKFKIEVTNARINVASKLVKVSLARMQIASNELTVDQVISTVKAATEAKGYAVKAPKKDLLDFIDNAKAVTSKDRSELNIKAEDGKLKLEVAAVSGKTKAVVKAEVSKSFQTRLDYEQVEEAVRKSGDEVSFKMVKDAFAMFHMKDSTTIISVNQETAGPSEE